MKSSLIWCLIASVSLTKAFGYNLYDSAINYVDASDLDVNEFGIQQVEVGFNHPQAAKKPIVVDLPSQTMPVQELAKVTNYHLIDQPIKSHVSVDQPIQQTRYITQPILRRRTIYTPIHRQIADQPIVRPELTRYTQVHPRVTEQPVLQQQIAQQDTYVQQYGESRQQNQAQVQQTNVRNLAPQVEQQKKHAEAPAQPPQPAQGEQAPEQGTGANTTEPTQAN